jgi:RHS repeat-associated protein
MTPSPTVAYDANGNTLSDPSGKSYTWDFENRLTQAVVPGTNGGTTTFKYDPFGRRIQKSGPLGTTNYLYDGANALEEVDNNANALARYTQGSYVDEPLSELRSGVVSYYEQDGVNSVSSLSNPAGALANTYSYDSFGKLTASTGTLTNPFQYTSRELDSETGIYSYRARYYDPGTGRFGSEDPIGFGGGINFYGYARDNPVLFNDPFGLWTNTGKPAPPNTNTIVCNGQDGIRVHLADYYELLPDFARCLGDCTTQHEEVHKRDALASNPKICRGSVDGIQIGVSGVQQDRTEIAAYTVEIQCLRDKERKDPCPTCKGLQDSQIKKAQDEIKKFRFFLSAGQ